MNNQITAVMKTYSNHDFTNAAVWAFHRFYPDIRIIFADGHPTDPYASTDLVWLPDAPCEYCQNAAIANVDTPYVLLMDNDTKVISPDALPLCLEALERDPQCAASGWYGLVIADEAACTAYVGTEYSEPMELDATQAAFSVHRTAYYREVGGMPLRPFWNVPEDLWKAVRPSPGYGGDLTLCRLYKEAGYNITSPRKAIPILHWGQAIEWQPNSKSKQDFDKWWFANTHHIRCNPLNSWRKHASPRPLS